LLVPNLAPALARAAGDRRFPSSGAGTRAVLASFMTAHGYFRLRSKHSFFKSEGQILAQIGTALRARAAPASCAKQVAYPEELAENVAEVLKSVGIESSHASRPGNTSVSKAVIRRALVSVDQNGIRFGELFEFVFCLRIIRIPVRMVLHGKLAIRALDFLLAALPLYS
jgi:hypothetical protein